jgi:choline kinase
MGVFINKVTLIVFSAGSGKRLMPYTLDCPKIFVSLKNKNIFDFVAAPLISSHICKKVIVVIKNKRRKYSHLINAYTNLSLVANNFDTKCHCSSSIVAVLEKLEGDVLFLNSDLLLDKLNVRRLIHTVSTSKTSLIFGVEKQAFDTDCDLQKVYVNESGSIASWSMKLDDFSHYVCGPVLIKAPDLEKLKNRVKALGVLKIIDKPCFTFFSEMLTEIDYKLNTLRANGFGEIDTPIDLRNCHFKRLIN